MIGTKAEDIAHDLLEFGEPEAAAWMLDCSDDEFVRVCSVADWLLYDGPTTATGRSMMIAKACALAAVYVHEGRPRDLRQSRRTKLAPSPVDGGRFVDYQMQLAAGRHYGVGDDAVQFWGQ
ncbi:hypothetical protein Back2_20140 [Nocardioides baekrokdamisoli]|uniref:Uncharacterized protein n=1 Tax=Nocardioides baekrokdamisoli TaxID=1804624 RepID=A0A3G9IFJ6_9ACTN|nr:hypothetical protein [Nocardioides baekrokdamisoli]BBH17727.1 hypothetical protein Back2_20140 [Nocardioides baekrokdamisoli]